MLAFFCPGCECSHWFQIGQGPGPRWKYNGNGDKPTIRESILVRHPTWTPPVTPENMEEWKRAPWVQTKVESICHSYVTDGRIQFLDDCTHTLKGKTVDLPAFDDDEPHAPWRPAW